MFKTTVKILLIDDRAENLHAMRVTLNPLDNVEIHTALSGNEGLNMMLDHEYAVVLLDVQMPEMDGFETASLMQHHKATKNVPIIFVTAISKDEDHVYKGYRTGAVDYLFKPLDPDILLCKVKVFINLFRQRKECEYLQQELQKSKNLESLGVLAGGIAHDFNNLITAVFGYVELAQLMCEPQSEIVMKLEEALKASKRAKHLARQLLTFSKGGWPIKTFANISDLICDTSTLLLSGSRVKVTIEIPAPLDEVEVDKGQINQVFQNLLLNAKQAMPAGGNLTIRAENVMVKDEARVPLLNKGKYIKVTFKDDGPGIDESIITKIFDPYFTSKPQGSDGHGLGLTIAHSIIKKHDGHIQVESKPGRGASFYIYLPVSREKENHLEVREKPSSSDCSSLPLKKILVLEDEEIVAATLKEMLKYLGYEARIAGDGPQAIDLFSRAQKERKPFDVAILDLTIRGGEGGEKVLGKLRAIDPGLRAIVASGYAEDPVMSDFRTYGFDGAIKKPFFMSTLAAELKKILSVTTDEPSTCCYGRVERQ